MQKSKPISLFWCQNDLCLNLSQGSLFYLQVPEFSFTNVMGADAMIFPGSAAVFDLDMIIPAGVDYAPMEVSRLE